jgi:hypothetical protein
MDSFVHKNQAGQLGQARQQAKSSFRQPGQQRHVDPNIKINFGTMRTMRGNSSGPLQQVPKTMRQSKESIKENDELTRSGFDDTSMDTMNVARIVNNDEDLSDNNSNEQLMTAHLNDLYGQMQEEEGYGYDPTAIAAESDVEESQDEEDQHDIDESRVMHQSPLGAKSQHPRIDHYHRAPSINFTGLPAHDRTNQGLKSQPTDAPSASKNMPIRSQVVSGNQRSGNLNQQAHLRTSQAIGQAEQRTIHSTRNTPSATTTQQYDQNTSTFPTANQQAHLSSGRKNTPQTSANENGKRKRHTEVTRQQRMAYSHHSSESEVPDIQDEEEHPFQYDIDYDPDVLGRIPYAELEKESFDIDPRAPRKSESNKATLEKELDDHRTSSPEDQRRFFDELSMESWDKAGDWFLDEFGSIMKRMQDARKKKRELAKNFEERIAKRHEAVEAHDRSLEKALGEMKQGGKDILKTKLKSKENMHGADNEKDNRLASPDSADS